MRHRDNANVIRLKHVDYSKGEYRRNLSEVSEDSPAALIQKIILLCGGDKGSQSRDVETARRLTKEWREA
jgi:hypothetical protein